MPLPEDGIDHRRNHDLIRRYLLLRKQRRFAAVVWLAEYRLSIADSELMLSCRRALSWQEFEDLIRIAEGLQPVERKPAGVANGNGFRKSLAVKR